MAESSWRIPVGRAPDFSGPSDIARDRPWSGAGYPGETGTQQEQTPGSSRSGSVNLDPTLDSPAGTSKGPPRGPRIRVSKACTPCRKVKLKCNGETPCGRCSALSLPMDECIYPPSLRGKTRRKKLEIEADRVAQGISSETSRRISQKRSRVDGGNGERDTRQWDAGWTMSSMKEDFAKWKHDEELTVNGPRNDAIWDRRHSNSNGDEGKSVTPTGRSQVPTISLGHEPQDRYTSDLPFHSEGHNPLGVLAEASANAGNAPTSPSPFLPTGGPGDRPDENGDGDATVGYDVPLERVLKKDAPHIMSLISITE